MENKLTIYNTLSRKKELFEPINPPFVGLYVCGQPCTGMLTSVTPVRQSPLTCYSVILNSWDTG